MGAVWIGAPHNGQSPFNIIHIHREREKKRKVGILFCPGDKIHSRKTRTMNFILKDTQLKSIISIIHLRDRIQGGRRNKFKCRGNLGGVHDKEDRVGHETPSVGNHWFMARVRLHFILTPDKRACRADGF